MRQVPLFSVVLLDQISLSIIFPVLTFIFFDKDSLLFATVSNANRSFWYGVCMALLCLSSFIIAPLLSVYSDKYSRKNALLLAALSASIFALFASFSLLTGWLILLLLGSFLGGRCTNANPVAQAIIGDSGVEQNKLSRMGYLQFFIATGAFIGPIIGGHCARYNFLLPCLTALAFSILSTLIAWCFSEVFQNDVAYAQKSNKKWLHFYGENRAHILAIIVPLLLIQISWSAYYQFIPVLLKTGFMFAPQKVGIFVGLIALWLCAAATIGLKLLHSFLSRQQVIWCAAGLILVGLVTVNVASWFSLAAPLWLSGALVPMGDVMAYCTLISLLSDKIVAADQGKAMGLCSMLIALVWTMSAVVGGFLLAINIHLPLLIATIGIILFFCYCRPKSEPRPSGSGNNSGSK